MGKPMTETANTPVQSPFSVPIFRAVWLASLVSSFGALIQSVGASWLMVSLSDSPSMVALVQSSTTLPLFLLSLISGALADSFDRRKLMLLSQCGMMIVSIGLTIAAFMGFLTPWTLLAFTFLIGCGTALSIPAWQAAVGDMVPRETLPAAVALNSVGFNIARSIGPAIGGTLVATVGAAGAFALNACSYTGMITVLARWKTTPVTNDLPRETLREAMVSGLRYVMMSPQQVSVLVRGLLFGLGTFTMTALMPLVTRDHLGGGATIYGMLLAIFGIGSVLAAVKITELRNWLGGERMVRSFIAITALGLVIVGVSRNIPLTIVGVLLGGAGWIAVLSTFNVTIQMSSPRWVVARALSVYQMATFGGMAAGGWLAGYLAEVTSLQTAFMIAAGIEVLAIGVGFLLPLPETAALDLAPLRPREAPKTALPIDSRAGPIFISIEYRIDPANSANFVSLMHERRRIRRRDGAQNWSLQRDLSDPEIWHERFQHSTWLNYVRHNYRRTRADLGNWMQIQSLHIGPKPPQVERTIEQQTSSNPERSSPSSLDPGQGPTPIS